ncbi:MAG: 5-oxoprolinase, partial [bacterium]|nr:5-oxoprolinase [bacterium]
MGRGDTATADAYLSPLIQAYVATARQGLGHAVQLRFTPSHGGLADAERFSGKDAILSGPAGGVVAYAEVCRLAGFDKAIGFDMGGTSTDVSRVDHGFDRIYEKVVAGVRLKSPLIHIETVAAGGGSILQFENGRFTVGPESAGANPGPACYGRGGPAAVTDANLVLGRIQPAYFPSCFGSNADQPLDGNAARQRMQDVADVVLAATGQCLSAEEVASGFVRIANANMVRPIKEISVAKGYNAQEYVLACFGGAGPQHACAIASALGMRHILLHPYAGVLSAYGMGLADLTHAAVESVLEPLTPDSLARLESHFKAMEESNEAVITRDGLPSARIKHTRTADVRYAGTDTCLSVEADENLRVHFESLHQQRYGFIEPDHAIEVVNVRVLSQGTSGETAALRRDLAALREEATEAEARKLTPTDAVDMVSIHFDRLDVDGVRRLTPTPTPVFFRNRLCPHDTFDGPAMVVEDASTVVVDPGWSARVDALGNLVLTAAVHEAEHEQVGTDCDPVMLEVFNNLFMSVADQMGKALENTSHSTNIKERLDFSCALFGADGGLVANAHHIPVHLGAMAESVRAVLQDCGTRMRPGDV